MGINDKMQVREPLASVIGKTRATRGEVMKGVFAYIKSEGLKDEMTSTIVCDTALHTITGKTNMRAREAIGIFGKAVSKYLDKI